MKRTETSDTAHEKDFVPVPIDSLKWKRIDDYVLNTVLGTHTCRAEVLDSNAYLILKPGEDERLEKLQAALFCDWVIATRGIILGPQLKYLMEVFDLSQSVLAEAVQVSQSAISQLIRGQTSPSKQTSRELAILFRIEIASPRFIADLARDIFPMPALQQHFVQEPPAVLAV